MTTDPDRYDTVSQVFHWLTAVVVLVAFVLGPGDFGRSMRNGIDPATRIDIVWHETLGIAVLVLTVLRLLWVAVRPAAPRHTMSAWMQRLSRLTHGVLWTLLLMLPLSALLALGTESHPMTLLGGLRVDAFPIITSVHLFSLADWGDVHSFLGDAIIWLAGLHALAAVYHHVRLKDQVLRSMLP